MNPYLTSLPSFGVIEVSGEDASAFLQGQFTSNLSAIDEHGHQFSAWCNAQGRVICTLRVILHDNRYLLVLPRELIASVCQRLKMYVLRSKVVVTDQSSHYCCIGQSGIPTDPEVLAAIRVTLDSDRTLMLVTADQQISVTTPNAEQLWQLADIRAGIPWICPQTSAELLPQELALEPLGALSYNKGCYPGQEIIARLHFRGRVKRSLYQGYLEPTGIEPEIGAKIIGHTGAQTFGLVVNRVRESQSRVAVLAVIDPDLAATDTLQLESGVTLHYEPLHLPAESI